MPIKEVIDLLDKIKAIHEKKNPDYAAVNKPFENFTRSAELISWFNTNQDKAFVSLIATKLARLATLLNSDKKPNNESIDDSFLDLATYCILWASYHSSINNSTDSYQVTYNSLTQQSSKPNLYCRIHGVNLDQFGDCVLCRSGITNPK